MAFRPFFALFFKHSHMNILFAILFLRVFFFSFILCIYKMPFLLQFARSAFFCQWPYSRFLYVIFSASNLHNEFAMNLMRIWRLILFRFVCLFALIVVAVGILFKLYHLNVWFVRFTQLIIEYLSNLVMWFCRNYNNLTRYSFM